MAVEQFFIPELSRQLDADKLVQEVRQIKGVQAVQVLPAGHLLRVEHTDQVDISTLIRAINLAGYADVSVLA